jgi:hypothetical protein
MGPVHPVHVPGYFECVFARRRLNRFRDLWLHRCHWAHFPPPSKSLDELIRAVPHGHERRTLITRELNTLVPEVMRDLQRAGVATTVARDGHGGKSDLNLIEGFEQLDQFAEPSDARLDDMVLGCLDRGLGAYAARQRQALFELLNPLLLVSSVLKIPVFILSRAGLDAPSTRTKLTETYMWTLRLVFLILLVIAATKLGFSIPWERVARLLGSQ